MMNLYLLSAILGLCRSIVHISIYAMVPTISRGFAEVEKFKKRGRHYPFVRCCSMFIDTSPYLEKSKTKTLPSPSQFPNSMNPIINFHNISDLFIRSTILSQASHESLSSSDLLCSVSKSLISVSVEIAEEHRFDWIQRVASSLLGWLVGVAISSDGSRG
mgnify:CR=1 FL=1